MADWVSILIGIGVITLLVTLFIVGYRLNKKTPLPEGCEGLTSECSSCGTVSCTMHAPSKDKVEVI